MRWRQFFGHNENKQYRKQSSWHSENRLHRKQSLWHGAHRKIIILVCLVFLFLVMISRRAEHRKISDDEAVTCKEAVVLLTELGLCQEEIQKARDGQEGQEYITYGQVVILDEIVRVHKADETNSVDGKNDENSEQNRNALFEYRYHPSDRIAKEEWYPIYFAWVKEMNLEEKIWLENVVILPYPEEGLCAIEQVLDAGKKEYGDCCQILKNKLVRDAECLFRAVTVCRTKESILTNVATDDREYSMEKALITASSNYYSVFYKNLSMTVPGEKKEITPHKEQIADLSFRDGNCVKIKTFDKKVSGKLLRRTKDLIELENQGSFALEESIPIYNITGVYENLTIDDIRIGYANVDYVLDDEKVCAGLFTDYTDAEYIRVLLTNPENGSYYFDEVTICVDGNERTITEKQLQENERIQMKSANLTDCVEIVSMRDYRPDAWYRGTIECVKEQKGLMLINELPLEEYLYAVVPSEMPASYPKEALKAQAVCARTYAYRFIRQAGLPYYGAHVDDTTAYQVYHNGSEYTSSTEAVKETRGMFVPDADSEEPKSIFYYSTSCGKGTDEAVWSAMSQCDVEEEVFEEYIMSGAEQDCEKEEAWYRWTCLVKNIDVEKLVGRIQEQYDANPNNILCRQKDGSFVMKEPTGYKKKMKIHNLEIIGRGKGGVAQELLIEVGDAAYKVLTENTIRKVLCEENTEIVRQDQSVIKTGKLLPSAFFVLKTSMDEGNVVGYTLYGGGYGHGVGMSQNGAKALANDGMDFMSILQYYFGNIPLRTVSE